MKINKKRLVAAFMTAVLAGPVMATSVAMADNNASGSPEEQADITNWIANTPQQISNNMAMQHISMDNLNGTRYIIQWGDTLSGISAATGISVAKLCYDNNIQNANLIYAGDVLILNRDGDVPAGYTPDVNPYAVAQTKVTIIMDQLTSTLPYGHKQLPRTMITLPIFTLPITITTTAATIITIVITLLRMNHPAVQQSTKRVRSTIRLS